MKIKSVEKFRNELYKNLKELWFGAEYTIYEASKCMFKYDLPAFLCCVFMTKTTYENVFKSLKGRVH